MRDLRGNQSKSEKNGGGKAHWTVDSSAGAASAQGFTRKDTKLAAAY
jgi:hypothetical protein